MKRFNKITIIGVGLIGGSIGLAVRKKRLAREVVGVFRRRATLNKALKAKAITRGTMDLKSGVKDADLVILATPVNLIPEIAKKITGYMKKGAVITDVGSTKKWIVDTIEKKLNNNHSISFIGSHPMAGSEHAGVEFAKSDLLECAPCIVTKTRKSNPQALRKVTAFWKSLGAKVTIMDPARHDRNVSLISHLAHIIAFSLAGSAPREEIRYAAEGFKDTTRVASSDPKLWADIFLTNRSEITKAASLFERYYKKVKKALLANQRSELLKLLERAKAKRDEFIYGKKA